jgi:glycerol-3-phosphate acyltransferase PlsY
VVLIFGSLIVLLLPLLHNADAIRALGRTERDRWLVVWPLALLAGWLTVATGNGALPEMLSPTAWAVLAVTVVVVLALFVTWRLRLLAYALPIAWGLLGAFVAEQGRNPALACVALAAAVAVFVAAVILTFRLRPGIERTGAG